MISIEDRKDIMNMASDAAPNDISDTYRLMVDEIENYPEQTARNKQTINEVQAVIDSLNKEGIVSGTRKKLEAIIERLSDG